MGVSVRGRRSTPLETSRASDAAKMFMAVANLGLGRYGEALTFSAVQIKGAITGEAVLKRAHARCWLVIAVEHTARGPVAVLLTTVRVLNGGAC